MTEDRTPITSTRINEQLILATYKELLQTTQKVNQQLQWENDTKLEATNGERAHEERMSLRGKEEMKTSGLVRPPPPIKPGAGILWQPHRPQDPHPDPWWWSCRATPQSEEQHPNRGPTHDESTRGPQDTRQVHGV